MEIKSLQEISFDRIFNAFNRAFEDYEMQLNKEQLRVMLKRRGFVPELSFAAFEKEDIVAFTLNGIGNFNGVNTAYDTGTGTVKEFRGKGLATKIFDYSIPFLKKAEINQYLLEVLQHNTKAVSVYKKLGFEVTREFHYSTQTKEEIKSQRERKNSQHFIQQIELNLCKSKTNFWDFYPSWQNSFDAIERKPEDFKIFGAYADQALIGYCVIEPNSGDITQIAVDPQHRRKGAASQLLEEALKHNTYNSVKIINTDVNCDSITGFIKSFNITIRGKQFEMIKRF
ncbi:MAG: GNAT family N-acetyltransferase [Bacteroidales bacterium]|nr:GNAT family N-acetyltransferase [Bacteroidales bacterium]